MEVYNQIKKDLTFVVIILICAQAIYAVSDIGKDDSDNAKERSGMIVRTDYKTGCQYLESQKGGLTPRLRKDGTHLCL